MSIQVVIDEAAAICEKMRENGRTAPKNPHACARLVMLWESTGVSVHEFCRRVKCNASSFYFWKSGKTTSGKVWPALVAALTSSKGQAMAAALNADPAFAKTHTATFPSPAMGLDDGPPASIVVAPVKRLSIEVRKWQALDLTLHDDEVAAEKASHVRVVDMAVEQVEKLCSKMSLRDLAFSRLESDSILNLADAIRARNAFEASQPRA
jgi:transposase-like protein